jgi:DNA (cytosine-5)-methyltransferase 1
MEPWTLYARQRSDRFIESDLASTQTARQDKGTTDLVLVYDGRGRGDGMTASIVTGDYDSRIGDYSHVVLSVSNLCVRRLTPRECERLQGFPDDHTRYEVDGREIKDTPRYRAIGNSIAIPCAEYVLRRIAERTGG